MHFPTKIPTCFDILQIILREFTLNKHISYTYELSNRLEFLVLKNADINFVVVVCAELVPSVWTKISIYVIIRLCFMYACFM